MEHFPYFECFVQTNGSLGKKYFNFNNFNNILILLNLPLLNTGTCVCLNGLAVLPTPASICWKLLLLLLWLLLSILTDGCQVSPANGLEIKGELVWSNADQLEFETEIINYIN